MATDMSDLRLSSLAISVEKAPQRDKRLVLITTISIGSLRWPRHVDISSITYSSCVYDMGARKMSYMCEEDVMYVHESLKTCL